MITPIILSGGMGSRLWPLSRPGLAKQLAPLLDGETLLQRTARRFADPERFAPPVVVCAGDSRFVVAEQLEAIGAAADLVIEPAPRDTLAAIVAGAQVAARRDGDPVVLVAPSDHLIEDVDAFRSAAETAAQAARLGRIVALGISPRRPATGYGYIAMGPALEADGAYAIDSFIEKPDAALAEQLVAEGRLWNAGLFCFQAAAGLREAARLAPEAVAAVEAAVSSAEEDLGALRLGPAFERAPKASWDIAIMEKTALAAVAPVDFPWSDLGDYRELRDASAQDAAGNAVVGDAVLDDCENLLVRGGERLVCALGVRDAVIIDTPDALLVADAARSQEVKALYGRLASQGRAEAAAHARVRRPWGWYQTMDLGDRFRVKRISVSPGKRLSLQRHHHRAEHWVVVRGTAEVTVDDKITFLRENESIFIPMGAVHRLANPGRIPVEIIEVQTGAYLEEDDIVRIEDDFGRSPDATDGA